MEKLPTLKTLDEVVALVQSYGAPVYVRYTRAPIARDLRHTSRNHATGQSEAGLSVNNLVGKYDGRRDRGFIAQQLREYQFLGGRPYLLTGEEVATGSDGEPVLRNPRAIALVAEEAINEAGRIDPNTGEVCDHKGARIERYTNAAFCTRCNSRVA